MSRWVIGRVPSWTGRYRLIIVDSKLLCVPQAELPDTSALFSGAVLPNDLEAEQQGVKAKVGLSLQHRNMYKSLAITTACKKLYQCLECEFSTNQLRNLNGEYFDKVSNAINTN